MRLIWWFSKVKFCEPTKNKIAILYANDHWIRTIILQKIPATTIALCPDPSTAVFVSPRLLFRIVIRVWKIRLRTFGLKSILRHLYTQYVLACLDIMNTKLVLSFIDNSSLLQSLTQVDTQRTYFAIQNGIRTLFCVRDSLPQPPNPAATIYHKHFFCFGKRDVALFKINGHKIENYYPVGSLVGGYYQEAISGKKKNRRFDLCLISQWHEHLFNEKNSDQIVKNCSKRIAQGIVGLNLLLSRLIEETGLSLVVCLRNKNDKSEQDFFKKAFKNKVIFPKTKNNRFSTYQTVDYSRLAIALNSTVLAEVFSSGQKVLWCNPTQDERFKMPEAGIAYFSGSNYAAFKQRILAILSASETIFVKKTARFARFINNHDSTNPPHSQIRKMVLKIIKNY